MSKNNISVEEINEKQIWEEFLLANNPGTFLQSWNWGLTNNEIGYKVKRFGFYRGTALVGIVQLIHQPAKRGPHFLIPGGPVIDFQDKLLTKFVFDFIEKFAREEKAWFVRIRPDIHDTLELRDTLKQHGLIWSPMHVHGEHTLILDITKSEDEILAQMRKNTRYAIKKSQEQGLKIKISKNPNDAEILSKLQKETVKRHKFIGFQKKLFEAQLRNFGEDNRSSLFTCFEGDKPLVSAIVIFYGKKAFYHHSASSESARGNNASYFTQWEIIKEAKRLGLDFYDFWGIAPNDDPKHRFAGVTTFKKGFGGNRVDWIHAHDVIVSKMYWLTYCFETARRIFRHL